jgi:hypothetical protein
MMNARGYPYLRCNKTPNAKCNRKHYNSLNELSDLTKFQEVMESINSRTSNVLSGNTAILADHVYNMMSTKIVDNPAVPGTKMVNTK